MEKNLSQISGKQWILTILLFSGFVMMVVLARYFSSNPLPFQTQNKDSSDVKLPEPIKYDAQKVVESSKSGKTFEEAKKDNPGIVTNPNIQYQDVKEQLKESNPEPVNHEVKFSGVSFTPVEVSIKRGDYVTWKNDSKSEMLVKGEGWGTVIPVPVGTSFTQGFDFTGSYPYSSGGDQQVRASVVVQ